MKLRPAQVLVELMIAFAVAVVAILALVQSSTKSLSNATVSKYETQATQYANEAIDWLRNQKNTSWPDFVGRSGTYCLNSLNWNTTGNCSGVMVGTSFSRLVILNVTGTAPQQVVAATVTVNRDNKEISRQSTEFRNY